MRWYWDKHKYIFKENNDFVAVIYRNDSTYIFEHPKIAFIRFNVITYGLSKEYIEIMFTGILL